MDGGGCVHWFDYPIVRLSKNARRYSQNRKLSPLRRLQEEIWRELTILRTLVIVIYIMLLALLLSALYLVLYHL